MSLISKSVDWFIVFFSATSIKSQVCEVVRIIRSSLYQIHALFYCHDERETNEIKGQLLMIVISLSINT